MEAPAERVSATDRLYDESRNGERKLSRSVFFTTYSQRDVAMASSSRNVYLVSLVSEILTQKPHTKRRESAVQPLA